MQILFNTDHNVTGGEKLTAPLADLITGELDRFSDRITRVEVHLGDENGKKASPNDKRCMLEARVEHMPPIAVSNHDDTYQAALAGAVDKLKHALEAKLDRLKDHHINQ